MECDCRSALCRRVVVDFDRTPLDRQRYYLDRNIVQGFIAERFGTAQEYTALAFVSGVSEPQALASDMLPPDQLGSNPMLSLPPRARAASSS